MSTALCAVLAAFLVMLIAVLAVLSRASGGGFGAKYLNRRGDVDDATGEDLGGVIPFISLAMLPEILFGATLGAAFWLALYLLGVPGWWLLTADGFHHIGPALAAVAAGAVAVWCYAWMETGHGDVLGWGRQQKASEKDRTQTLTPVVDALADLLGITKTLSDGFSPTTGYCRLFMSVKGFLIGLPFGGVILAVLWPLAYEVGARLRGRVSFDPHALTELLGGAGAGVAAAVPIWLIAVAAFA